MRPRVLVVCHDDGYVEVFGDQEISVRIERMPVARSREAERTAEGVFELLLPKLWRDIYFANCLRASGTSRPLLPKILQRSLAVPAILEDINELPSRIRAFVRADKVASEGRRVAL